MSDAGAQMTGASCAAPPPAARAPHSDAAHGHPLPTRNTAHYAIEQKLLDTLENEVDSGNASLKRETERTKIVTRDAKTCWLYVVICICLAVLILLVALRWW